MAQKISDSLRRPTDRPLQQKVVGEKGRMLPAMPIFVDFQPMRVEVSFQRKGEEILFHFRPADGDPFTPDTLDAHRLRETFLDVRTPGEALDFLSLGGHFLRLRDQYEEQVHAQLTWSQFKQWQELVRFILVYGPLQIETGDVHNSVKGALFPLLADLSLTEHLWLAGHPDRIAIRPGAPVHPDASVSDERKALRAEIAVDSVLEAILATVYVDSLNGINYRLCKLPDCHTLFEVTSKHEREYCSQPCAHKASVRRRRAEAKATTNAARNKARQTRSKKAKG